MCMIKNGVCVIYVSKADIRTPPYLRRPPDYGVTATTTILYVGLVVL